MNRMVDKGRGDRERSSTLAPDVTARSLVSDHGIVHSHTPSGPEARGLLIDYVSGVIGLIFCMLKVPIIPPRILE